MAKKLVKLLRKEYSNLEASGLFKQEMVVPHPQGTEIELPGEREVINFCSNNYLGFAQNPKISEAGIDALKEYGYGTASTRIILGTQPIHKELEQKLSEFLCKEDTIIFNSDYDANIGVFEALLTDRDTIFCDERCHASIIDGIRLCKADRIRFLSNNMENLEYHLKKSKNARIRLIVIDGIYSTSGVTANISSICELAKKYHSIVMVNDAQGTGVMGENGRGTPEHCNVVEEVDIISGSFGYALGGVSGGFVSSNTEIIRWLRQRSRPYILSNSISPVLVGSVYKALEILQSEESPLNQLRERIKMFREGILNLGFKELSVSEHPILCVLSDNAITTQKFTDRVFQEGIFVTGLCYPSVPKDDARIRVKISAQHTEEQIQKALDAFQKAAEELL